MEQPKNNLKIVTDKKNARMILPNMLTLIGVCIGLTSIRFALDERFEFAIIAIIFAGMFFLEHLSIIAFKLLPLPDIKTTTFNIPIFLLNN